MDQESQESIVDTHAVNLEQGYVDHVDNVDSVGIVDQYVDAILNPEQPTYTGCAVCCDQCHTQNVTCGNRYRVWCTKAHATCRSDSKQFYPRHCPTYFAKYTACCGEHCAHIAESCCTGWVNCLYHCYCKGGCAMVGWTVTGIIMFACIVFLAIFL